MDTELSALIQKAVAEGSRTQLLLNAGITFICTVLGGYLGAYAKIKGEHLAKKEDIDDTIREVKATNTAIEEIKADSAYLKAFNETKGQQRAIKENFEALLDQQRQLMEATTRVQQQIQEGFAKGLEEYKWELQVNLEFKKSVMEPRRIAYFKLWALLEPMRASGDGKLDLEQRKDLETHLRSWYHGEAGGALLSLSANRAFQAALKALADPFSTETALLDTYDAGKARAVFSALRTQMKEDLGIYSPEEAKTPNPATDGLEASK